MKDRRSNRKSTEEMFNIWEERRRDGDIRQVANRLWYSPSHISNVINGRRGQRNPQLRENIARELYRMSYRRVRNEVLRTRHGVENVEYMFSSN